MNFINEARSGNTLSPFEPRAGTFCVSPEGEILVPGTSSFYERIGYRNPDFDLGDYAVRNMGFVAISRVSPDRLRVRFRPALVTGTCVDTVLRYLLDRGSKEIELNYLTDTWQTEVQKCDPRSIHRIIELCAQFQYDPDIPSYHVQPVELSAVAERDISPLQPMFQKWRVSFGQFNDTTLPFLMRFAFGARMVIITAAKPGDPLCFQFFGSEVQVYSDMSMCELIGKPITDQPDREYGQWTGAQYKSFLEDNRPRLDHVHATIRESPDSAKHVRYERLLLPWRSPTGGPVITCASVVLSRERLDLANENMPSGAIPSGGCSRRRPR